MARQQTPPKTDVTFPGTDTSLPISSLSAKIVIELASGLSDAAGVRERYGISEAQWAVLKRSPAFRAMLKEAIDRLAGDMNAANRIKLKADVMLEDNLKVLDEIANDKDAQSMARIKAIEVAAQLAGKGPSSQKEGTGGGGSTFSLNIVIGDNKVEIAGGEQQQPALEHQSE